MVEAKRTQRDARVGQQQAKLYADCLETAHGQRPVVFYTDGYQHWMWDDTAYPPRPVQGFYTKDELFIRSLVGLDREAAVEAMNGFIDAKLLSANQIDFVNLIVGHLTENGVMDASALLCSPSTDVAPRGPTSLFSADQVGRLVGVLEHVRSTAAPDVA